MGLTRNFYQDPLLTATISDVFTKSLVLLIAAWVTLAAVPCQSGTGADADSRIEQTSPSNLANVCAEITRKDATHYTISNRAVRAATGNLPALSRSMRILPYKVNGSVIGYRLTSLRRRSLATCLGFKNGDVIRAVNDIDITMPDVVMHNYAKIIAEGTVRFSILRRGKSLVLEVTIL